MIGTVPMTALAPLDYRNALDAAMALIDTSRPVKVCCDTAELQAEVRQRWPNQMGGDRATATLWIEPSAEHWQAHLATIVQTAVPGAQLIIIGSQPLTRLISERRRWTDRPLGLAIGGGLRLRQALRRAGFRIKARYGFHSAMAIGLNMAVRFAAGWGRPDLADRLQAAARLSYVAAGPVATLATVALIDARKEA
ncbi:MAG: hypothetical protein MI924_24950 [Chloroflexales bacterium]|nr:hypothetical protein [Chloroflexales bacterium]